MLDMKNITYYTKNGNIYGLKECFNAIEARIDDLYEQNSELQVENMLLRNKHYKDEELAKLQAQIEEYNNGLCITNSERNNAYCWFKEHCKVKHYDEYQPLLNFILTPTPFGVFKEIECLGCHEKYSFSEDV